MNIIDIIIIVVGVNAILSRLHKIEKKIDKLLTDKEAKQV